MVPGADADRLLAAAPKWRSVARTGQGAAWDRRRCLAVSLAGKDPHALHLGRPGGPATGNLRRRRAEAPTVVDHCVFLGSGQAWFRASAQVREFQQVKLEFCGLKPQISCSSVLISCPFESRSSVRGCFVSRQDGRC